MPTDEETPLIVSNDHRFYNEALPGQTLIYTPAILITELLIVIKHLLPFPISDPSTISSGGWDGINIRVLRYIQRLDGGKQFNASIFAVLRTIDIFKRQASLDDSEVEVCLQRVLVAEALAKALLHRFPDRKILYLEVLTKDYEVILGGRRQEPLCAIEIAIAHHLTNFLSDPLVVNCNIALWNGTLLREEEDDDKPPSEDFVIYKRWDDATFIKHCNPIRLSVPRNQNFLNLFMQILFLLLYTYVINNRKEYPTDLEYTMYVFVLAYFIDDVRQLFRGGKIWMRSLFKMISIILWPIFVASFYFRLRAIYSREKEDNKYYDDISYDLLSTAAVFMWVRALTFMDGFRFFGTTILIVEWMLREAAIFFILIIFVFIGFGQSFKALGDNVQTGQLIEFILTAFFGSPDWRTAAEYHPIIGKGLLMLFLFFSGIMLLNILIALFSDGYSRVQGAANAEYLTMFAEKCWRILETDDHYPFTVPFNIFEIIFLIPIGFCLPKRANRRFNKFFLVVFFWPALLLIASIETRMVRSRSRAAKLFEVGLGSIETLDDEFINAARDADTDGRKQEMKKIINPSSFAQQIALSDD